MGEMAVLEVSGFDEFGDDESHLLASHRFILLILQFLNEPLLVLMENQVVEDESINRLVYLREESFHFLSGNCEVFVHHLLEVGAFFNARVYVLGDNVPNLFQSEHVMAAFVFFVEADAALGFADGGLVGAGEAASELNGGNPVDVAQNDFVLGVARDHWIENGILQSMSIQFKIEEEQDHHHNQNSLSSQDRKLGKYILGQTIGEGTFNKVRIGRHVYTNEQVAVKMIEKRSVSEEADQLRLKKELKILRKVRHPHIVQLYQILEDKEYYYLVTEYASRGELFQHIVKNEKLTEFEASKFLQQLLDAVEYLHEIGVVHRDLKPQNILLDYKYNVKIVDFGLSDIYSKGQKLTAACGSPCYAPPEMLAGKGYDPLKVDVWSLGIVLYAMCFGYLPFDHPDPSELFKIIKEGKYELPEHASQDLTDILRVILQVDPIKRANIQEIRGHHFCRINQVPVVLGIIQGLSTMPFEEKIEVRMRQLHLDTNELYQEISSNKHNDRTATYYLLLQQELRQRNQTFLNYYLDKYYVINRYKLIEKVKDHYEKRLLLRISTLQQSRRTKKRSSSRKMKSSSHNKRSKTSDKKYHTGLGSNNSKTISTNLFHSPRQAKQAKENNNPLRVSHRSKKKLKRT